MVNSIKARHLHKTESPSITLRDTRRILLTGGRAPATLELARLLHRAGHAVFVGESFLQHICRFSRAVEKSHALPGPRDDPDGFIDGLLGMIEREKIDLLIPTCEELFHIAAARDVLARRCVVFCEGIDRLQPLHDKWRFIATARRLGLATPRTMLLAGDEFDPAARIDVWLHDQRLAGFVLKPVYSRFGQDAYRFPRGLTGRRRLPNLRGREWVVQEFLPGRPIATYGVADRGELLAHVAYPIRFTGGGCAIAFEPIDHPAVLQWVRRFVEAYAYTGQIAFDFIEDAAGRVLPIECNPRLTSGIHLLADDPKMAAVYVGRGSASPPRPTRRPNHLAAAMMLFGLSDVRSAGDLIRWTSITLFGRDIVFRWSDPMPALGQFVTLWGLWKRSRRHKTDLTGATTWDIEWNGPVEATPQEESQPEL